MEMKRRINKTELHQECINNDWCTYMNTTQYERFLNCMGSADELSDSYLLEFAKYIYQYSDNFGVESENEKWERLSYIMTRLNARCRYEVD